VNGRPEAMPARSWAQFPEIATTSRWDAATPLLRSILAIAIVALPATGRSLALVGPAWTVGVVVGGAVAALAVSCTPTTWPPTAARVFGVLGGVVLAALTGGRIAGAWILLGAIGAGGVSAAWEQHRGRAALRGVGPVLGATVGAAVIAALHPRAPLAHLLVLSATALGLATARWYERMASVDAAARRGSERVGEFLGIVVFAILAIPFVALPWLVGRIVRWDATWSPTRPRSAWSEAADAEVPSKRTWQPAAPPRTWPWTRRASRAVVRLGVCLLVLAVVFQAVRNRAAEPDPGLLSSPAMAGADYWPDLIRAQDQLRSSMEFGSYTYEQPDVTSRYLNIRDGHRVTWSPPADPSCRAPVVWVFGGSTTFGEGQRDEHTVPSELARAAWDDGVALDVTNFGQLGDPHWVEVRRLEEALGTTDERPDLVIFYDGANEVITRIALNDQGHAADQTFVSYLDSGLFLQLDRYLRPLYEFTSGADALDVQPEVSGRLGSREVGDLAARQYRLSLQTSQRLATDEDLPTLWFNQPTAWTTIDQPTADRWGETASFGKAVSDRYTSELPDGVIDLSTLFQDTDDPIFYDTAHTNEQGARQVGEAIWAEAREKLDAACAEDDACC